MKKYLEIVHYNGDVDTRIDVSTQSQHNIDRIERGANINLNHANYYTRVIESPTELPTDLKKQAK